MRLRIGIIFGGFSREREVSFAGGRTVYDNLDKSLFEPVPIFVDSFGNFVLLNWKYIYKGSIRDFYPPVDFLPPSLNNFQIYAESIEDSGNGLKLKMLAELGTPLNSEDLKNHIDFAFLCLHGSGGEDGSIQGLLEYLKIPYSGSGIFSSALGMDKSLQRKWMENSDFETPKYIIIKRSEITDKYLKKIHSNIKNQIGIPCVIKPAHQGSSIGATVLSKTDFASFEKAILKSFFIQKVAYSDWKSLNKEQQISFVRDVTDIRQGIGFPLVLKCRDTSVNVFHPENLLSILNRSL
jgi:UDP-N-acetylmuramate--alanine ligase